MVDRSETATRAVNGYGDWATVEVDDPHAGYIHSEEGGRYQVDREYKLVEILPSGWVRCVHSREANEDETEDFDYEDVDYYPPQRVNRILAGEVDERVE